ncbi:MAG: hypothetical protein HN341_13495 [Verrucomicrobia bacterium]|nr:hypothetical protein [Verrucomicrobiota bacterium]
MDFYIKRLLFAAFASVLLAAGCASPYVDDYRLVRYRPVLGTGPAEQAVSADPSGNSAGESMLRSLGSGDRILIYLRGIPVPEEIQDIVDGLGEVTLPYLGAVKLAGKTTSEAESLIESLYVDGHFYQQINVIVVAEDEVYFVQGQVAKQGKFLLSGPVTLLQAISEAGGYTPFANRKKIKVIRGSEVLYYNGKDIASGEIPDPPIRADDIIEVLQKW